ncbi:MAG: hypothetical protein E5V91_19900 [Mesorhizobium sp.]|uniref:hypothetical protein n=1 Tax=unclassified Mesorhizobium TaxID=325217 RepID=UPI001209DE9A|nr:MULTISPECIES: hypothetical protein [unclassified Mesorhizobium]TIV37038.1 MAG: hypothetical protein E5V91_19900 [Mesorhizobium sp.]
MRIIDDRLLVRLRDPDWFVKTFKQVAESECADAGFFCAIEDRFLKEAHAVWLTRCLNNETRIAPPEPHFHYRIVGWLCWAIISEDYHIELSQIRHSDSERTKMLRTFPTIYLALTVCSIFAVTVHYELKGMEPPLSPPHSRTLWSACENLQEDPSQAVHFMQILCGDYRDPASFL